jgi:ATP/maltotriose-dependent transcriptional regulator MalT
LSSQTAQTAGLGFGVIEPKLLLPRVQPGMLRRSSLLEMTDDDGGVALTVVNAPVCYGKTTLLRS